MMPIYKGIIGCAKPQRRILSDEAQVTNEIRVRGRWMPNHVKFFIGIHPWPGLIKLLTNQLLEPDHSFYSILLSNVFIARKSQ